MHTGEFGRRRYWSPFLRRFLREHLQAQMPSKEQTQWSPLQSGWEPQEHGYLANITCYKSAPKNPISREDNRTVQEVGLVQEYRLRLKRPKIVLYNILI
jgi:hypothetical protein